MTELSRMLNENNSSKECESIDIDYLLHDIMIIKAESLKSNKIFGYADYLEKQLMKIKNGDAILEGIK